MKLTQFGHTIIKSSLLQSVFPWLSFLTNYQPLGSKQIFLTVDVEAGYLDRHNHRQWMRYNSKSYQGYLRGLANILALFDQEKVKATLFICPQCFSAPPATRQKIINLIISAHKSGHQIGLHLHPREDVVLHKKIGKKLEFTSAKFYSISEIDRIFKAEREVLRHFLGPKIEKEITAFRWGNFAADNRVFPILRKNNFLTDSSVSPLLSGHFDDDRYYDWREISSNQNFQKNKIKEIPITTFKLAFLPVRAEAFWGSLLFIPISRGGQINVMVHSCECNYQNGQPTYVVCHLQKIIQFAKTKNYSFSLIQ